MIQTQRNWARVPALEVIDRQRDHAAEPAAPTVAYKCSACDARFAVRAADVGSIVRCPHCQDLLQT
jgi:uncharacterized paraquat-inducible protein A